MAQPELQRKVLQISIFEKFFKGQSVSLVACLECVTTDGLSRTYCRVCDEKFPIHTHSLSYSHFHILFFILKMITVKKTLLTLI